jgi:hypothetical protein
MSSTEAIIIPFPKKVKEKQLIVKRSAELFHSWNKLLINPHLKGLYKQEISWLERWYLEVRHLVNNDKWDHPIVLMVTQDHTFNKTLRDCCLADIKVMEKLAEDYVYRDSSVRQRKRLIIWHNKFASLLNQDGSSADQ